MTVSAEGQTSPAVEGFRLSPQQRRIWMRHSVLDATPIPTLVCCVDVDGDLDQAALRKAVGQLVERHEILRTGFHIIAGLMFPVQAINAAAHVPIETIGRFGPWGDHSVLDFDESLNQWMRRPVDPAGDTQFSAALCRRSANRHSLLLRVSSLCADSVGMLNLARELVMTYQKPSTLSTFDEVLQYADVSEWLNQFLEDGESQEERSYWRREAATAPPAPSVPFARSIDPATAPTVAEPVSVRVSVDGPLWSGIQGAAGRLSVSPRVILEASWALLLYRYTRQESLTLTVAADGRRHEGLDAAIGLFARHLPMGIELCETMAVGEAVQEVARRHAEVSGFEDYFDLEEWERRSIGHAERPTLSVAFTHCAVPPLSRNGDTTFSLRFLREATDRFPLELSCVEYSDGVGLTLRCCPRGYLRGDMTQMADSLTAVIEGVTTAADLPIGQLRLTHPDGDRLAVSPIRRTSATKDTVPTFVHELFAEHAAARPDTTAVVYEKERLSYAELYDCARRIATLLRKAGVHPGQLVPLFVERGLESVTGLLGILMAGAGYVPLDPGTPSHRLAFLLQDIGARMVLTQEHLFGRLPPGLKVISLAALRNPPPVLGSKTTAVRTHPNHPAYVIYTSGTTGAPKGVVVEHSQLAHYVAGVTEVLGEPTDASFAMVSPLFTDLGNTALFHALCGGGTLHVISKNRASDPDALAAYFREEAIDRVKIVPSHLRALLDAASRPADLIPRVTLVSGGEPLHKDLAALIGVIAPTCKLVNHYGPTEATVGISTHGVAIDGIDARSRTVPIGKAIGNARIHLLDPSLEPVPDWVPGEVYVAGPQVARGYLGCPDLTAERFIPDPFADVPGARMYRTGDLARRLADGSHEFIGRVDDQVKVRGFRVELAEIEFVLRTHPDVGDAAVLARDAIAGDVHLVAYVVRRDTAGAGNDLRQFLLERLPDHMIPDSVEVLDILPLTANGKLDRKSLRDRVPSKQAPQRPVVAPRDDREAEMLAIWEETLRIRPLSVTDNFFDVGGNSLLAVRLIAQIRKTTGRNLPLASLFTAGTVEAMARLTRDDTSSESSIVVPIQPHGARRPFFCIHAGGGTTLGYLELARHLGPEQPFYGLQSVGLDGRTPPLTNLTEMARQYVESVRSVQPEGPYLLGGWCLGGILAYEMTRLLRFQGHEVGLLVLVDSESPLAAKPGSHPQEDPVSPPGDGLDDATMLRRFALHYGIDDMRSDLDSVNEEQQLQHLLDLALGHNVLPPGAGLAQLENLLRVYESNIRAVNEHIRHFVLGDRPDYPMVLYRPAEELNSGHDHSLGWAALAVGQLSVETVPGDHDTVLRRPAVAILAERLGTRLTRLDIEAVGPPHTRSRPSSPLRPTGSEL